MGGRARNVEQGARIPKPKTRTPLFCQFQCLTVVCWRQAAIGMPGRLKELFSVTSNPLNTKDAEQILEGYLAHMKTPTSLGPP